MVFNEKEMVDLCKRLGIGMVEGNIPLIDGRPITDDDIKNLFKTEYIRGKGKVITFEGLDASFKETNAKKLYEYLSKFGIECTLVSFPRYQEESSIFVRSMLNGEYGETYPFQNIYFYALDRFDYIKKNNVKERLEKGEWFIFDRYVESNIIYQSATYDNITEKEDIRKTIIDLEYGDFELPKPDITFAMYSDFNLTKSILDSRIKKDIYESNDDFLKKVFNEYDKLINIYDWCRINVIEYDDIKEEYYFRTEEDIFNDIICTLFDKQLFINL